MLHDFTPLHSSAYSYAGRCFAHELDTGDVIEVASRGLAVPLCIGSLGEYRQIPCPLAVVLHVELSDGQVQAVLALLDDPTKQKPTTFDPEFILTCWERS